MSEFLSLLEIEISEASLSSRSIDLFFFLPGQATRAMFASTKKHGELVCNTEVVVDNDVEVVEVTKKNLGSLLLVSSECAEATRSRHTVKVALNIFFLL